MDLQSCADELYAGAPASFVARRGQLVKDAKAAGDKALADEVGALRRPSVSAWYVNLLTRSSRPALGELLALGAQMRTAQAAMDLKQVAALTPQRRTLEQQVLRDLRDLLAEREAPAASQAALTEVLGTLNAAVSDAKADEVVRGGCLVRGLVYAGFGVDLDGAVDVVARPRLRVVRDEPDADTPATREPQLEPDPTAEPGPTAEPEDEEAAALAEAQRTVKLAQARKALTAATAQQQAAAARVQQAEVAVDEAQREVDALHLQLAAARTTLHQLEDERTDARSELEAAEAAVAQALADVDAG